MRIINIVDSIDVVNFGIWNAAMSTSEILEINGIKSELWSIGIKEGDNFSPETSVNIHSSSIRHLKQLIIQQKLKPSDDVIVTHGCWRFPTRWGYYLEKQGFKWVYTPHGMLDSWAMNQKKIKKRLYFYLCEKRMARMATLIRVLSLSEENAIHSYFNSANTVLIPNGIDLISDVCKEEDKTKVYLFLSRLHRKKGILPLVEGWKKSKLNNSPNHKLVIAGPDDGDLSLLQAQIKHETNIRYIGAVYGIEKNELLNRASFFLLPSFSEGFPVSVLEAMSRGAIPVISSACNMPEVFNEGIGVEVIPNEVSIMEGLNETLNFSNKEIRRRSFKAQELVRLKYSLQAIAKAEIDEYRKIMNG